MKTEKAGSLLIHIPSPPEKKIYICIYACIYIEVAYIWIDMKDVKKEHERYKKEHYERKTTCMTD